eukprot:GILK01009438.1.p1 GENE.GILK01009438.1~~GILK01009438.1.p1  ORF type:complete len:456 (+),score=26.12 GILK01009438.1:70-1368(+)
MEFLSVRRHEKGLQNESGQNNCFLNAVVQSLWHIKSFSSKFTLAPEHIHPVEEANRACLFCALKTLFAAYQFSDETNLPPDELRSALSSLFSKDNKFALHRMEDASETFEAILNHLHGTNEGTYNSVQVCVPLCIPHLVFGFQTCEVRSCECGATSDPMLVHDFVHRVYVSDLLRNKGGTSVGANLETTLRNLSGTQSSDIRSCPDDVSPCSRTCRSERWCLSAPQVFVISLVWPTADADNSTIKRVLRYIRPALHLREIFKMAPSCAINGDANPKYGWMYVFRGMVCYYGRHYVCFFFNHKYNKWIYFNDRLVQVLDTWKDVLVRCIRGNYQPVLLFFENPSWDSVSPGSTTNSCNWSHNKDGSSGTSVGIELKPISRTTSFPKREQKVFLDDPSSPQSPPGRSRSEELLALYRSMDVDVSEVKASPCIIQ